MKQYLLIPIEEIDDILYKLKESKQTFETIGRTKQLNSLKSKGEIVEIKNNKLTDLFKEYSHSKTKQTFESFVVNEQGFKLIKTIK